MKKFVSIVLAMLMVCAMAVTVCAEEVLYSEDTPFWDAGNWSEFDLTDADGNFFELLNNENAYLVLTRSKETHLEFADGIYEKYCLLDTWWSAKYPNAADAECQWIELGTGGHGSAEEARVLIDCVSDDGIKVMWPAKAIYDLLEANGALGKGTPHFICNSSATADDFKITNVSIIVPDAPIEAPAAETTEPAADTTEPAADTTEPAADTTEPTPAAETSEPADTGIVLALLPMAVAAAAVVVSKRK